LGKKIMDPYRSVKDFERAVREYSGSPYAIAVDSCSNALALCCQCPFLCIKEYSEIEIPSITYPSVASAIVHAGGRIKFNKNKPWQKIGWYELSPSGIIDSAKYMARNMFTEIRDKLNKSVYICLSFHAKKTIPIGRGGMILTDDKRVEKWLRSARFDGRHEKPLHKDSLAMAGWNFYMTPEQASRGLILMQWLPDFNLLKPDPYIDLSIYKFFTEANR
jgi:dTDP-4-amino-4,6-dideoxygalactose transaminase